MDAQIIRERSRAKFEKDAHDYEQTSDGCFCSRAYPAIVNAIGAQPFASLLDVGCGTGAILSSFLGKARLYGIDLSANMIARAQEALKDGAELRVGDAEALPWPQASVDAVSCTFSFHHYPHPEKVLSEMSRVLKDGGRLIIADPWLPAPFRQMINAFMRYSQDGDYRNYSKREMRRMLENTGFDLTGFTHPTNDSFLLTAKRVVRGGDVRHG